MRQEQNFGAVASHSPGVGPRLVASHCVSMTAFLIDTPAIRNTPNFLRVNARMVSNRHSRHTLRFTQFQHLPNYGGVQGGPCAKINAPQIQEMPLIA
jgi:hypothetical protein